MTPVTAAQVAEVRDRILADGIPALTFAAGANPVDVFGVGMNYNFHTAMADGWPRTNDEDEVVWHHSDIKNVAYFFLHRLFQKIVKLQ